MKITDLKCTVLGSNPVVRITTDEGISGLGEVEGSKQLPEAAYYVLQGLHSWRRSHGRRAGNDANPQRWELSSRGAAQ